MPNFVENDDAISAGKEPQLCIDSFTNFSF